MSRDPRFISGPMLSDDIKALQRRVALLEANKGGFVASAGAFTKASVLPLVAYGTSTTDVDCASSGAFEDDTALDVSITTTVTCTLVCILTAKVASNTARTTSWRIRLILDDTTTGGQTEANAMPVAGTIMGATQAVFTGVTSGTHKIEPQMYRENSADTVGIRERMLTVLAIPE